MRNKSIDQKISFIAKEKWMAEEQNFKMNPEWPWFMLRTEQMDNITVVFSEHFILHHYIPLPDTSHQPFSLVCKFTIKSIQQIEMDKLVQCAASNLFSLTENMQKYPKEQRDAGKL